MAAWVVGVVLALSLGLMAGKEIGAAVERQSIANDCKYGGSFVLRHTGYQCHVL